MASRRRKKRRKKGSFSSLLLILGVLSLTRIQAAYHEHVIQFTTVGTGSYLLDHFMVDFLDDVQVFSYDKHNQQLMAKEAWISQALGAKFITKIRQKLVDHEKSFLWFLKKLTQNETKYDVPPEVTVSHHEAMDGITTLACSATGFYPSSILLHWQKGKEIIVAGKESSSGTLPNADSTFYQRITIELPPEDPGTNYDCVVDHIELGTPKAYPVHVKYPKKRSWTATFTILGVVILVLSCAASFIMWKKMKTGYRILECVTLEGIIYTT